MAGPLSRNLATLYIIGLFGYCQGSQDDNTTFEYCSKPTYGFWFNLTEHWGVEKKWIDEHSLSPASDLHVYELVARWVEMTYLLSLFLTLLQLIVGSMALISRSARRLTSLLFGVS